jgi:hypothetical protein
MADLVCRQDSMIRMTFAEVVARVVMSKAVGYWFQSQTQSCCSGVGMPGVLVVPVGNCRQDKVYRNSRGQDSKDVRNH